MDNANEQKWFVYIGDNHQGPFTVQEIQQKISEGIVTTEQYVWCEGMADWLPMLDVANFKSLAAPQAAKKVAPQAPATYAATKATVTAGKKSSKQPMTLASSGGNKKNRIGALLGVFIIVSLGAVAYSMGLIGKDTQDKITVSVMSVAEPVIDILAEKIPALSELLSPIPQIDDVNPEDLKALKTVAKIKLSNGPKIEIAQKTINYVKPSIVISSNLPDGLSLEVYLLGKSDTLLNATNFFLKKAAVVQKKVAIISNIADPANQPIPKGDYIVLISETNPELQPASVKAALQAVPEKEVDLPTGTKEKRKILFMKSLFLGGVKDANYTERLKTYHENLVKKSTQELNEVRVFTSSLRSQYNLTNNQFNELKKQKNPKTKRKLWDPFHKKWEEFGVQLLQSFQSWSPAALEKDFIQGRLYQALQDAGVKVVRVHQAQDIAAKKSGRVDPKTESEITSLTQEANMALDLLQSKIDFINTDPVLPGGLPRRSN